MDFTNIYYAASGFGISDCCFLGQHFLTKYGFHPDRAECWVIRAAPAAEAGKTSFTVAYGVAGWLTGLWRSPTTVYATELLGRMHICRNLDAIGDPSSWSRQDFKNTIMQGVWGLNDQCVFAWCKIGLKPAMLFWDGKIWTELPAPPDEVAGMHGVSPELVYAVGANGLIARWDGRTWTRVVVPTKEFFISVFVAGADEMYAVGHGAALWEGSSSGWGKVADGPGVLSGVVQFAGQVFVGAGEHGLMRRERNKLVSVDPDLHAQALDARRLLLVSSHEAIAESTDGAKFTAKARGLLARTRDAQTPLWGYEAEEDEAEDEEGDSP